MAAGKHNIIIDQGADFSEEMVVKVDGVVKDLTGYFARGQMRSKETSVAVAATFDCTITDAVNGVLKRELDPATTTALVPGVYKQDLEIYTAGDASVIRLLYGQATVRPETTR
jgi:hypothetical protein